MHKNKRSDMIMNLIEPNKLERCFFFFFFLERDGLGLDLGWRDVITFYWKQSIIYMFYTKFITYYVYFIISIYLVERTLKKNCFRDKVLVPSTKSNKSQIWVWTSTSQYKVLTTFFRPHKSGRSALWVYVFNFFEYCL